MVSAAKVREAASLRLDAALDDDAEAAVACSMAAARTLTKDSTAASSDQFGLSLISCSSARHTGHLPSFDSARRMHVEQNV